MKKDKAMTTRRIKPRNKLSLAGPSKPSSSFIEEATKLDGMHPHEFLLAVMGSKHVSIHGIKHEPTFEQRVSATEHLSAALQGRKTPEEDDL
jgi:hypothetical protein